MGLLRLTLTAYAALLVAGCGSAAPTMHVPVGSSPRPTPPLLRPTLPLGNATSASATEAALIEVVQYFCVAGVAANERDADLAPRVKGIAVIDPWQGERFMFETPRTTWSRADTPRLFFWLGASEVPGFRECNILAFDGDNELMARATLTVLEHNASVNQFGAPTYDVRPLSQLAELGSIERAWTTRDFSALIALDRSNPELTGLHINVHARPAATTSEQP